MERFAFRISFFCLCLALSANAQNRSDTQRQHAWQEIARHDEGFVIWESNRTGRYRLWMRNLDGSNLRQLSRDEKNRDHFCPHVSPDGKRVVYISHPKTRNTYKPYIPKNKIPMHIIDLETGEDRILIPNVRAYRENRAAVWVNNHELIYIAADGSTRQYDLNTNKSRRLTVSGHDEYGWLINPTKTHATTGRPFFSPYSARKRAIASSKKYSGCQPYFSQDGRWGYWMGGAGGPIRRIHLATGKVGAILKKNDSRMPAERSYLYFPMLSHDLRFLSLGASPNQHDHHTADYDIFIVPTDPQTLDVIGKPVRYTFHKGTDRYPSLFIRPLELKRLRETDQLHLGDVEDRAQKPNTMPPQRLHIQPPQWPGTREGLVFLWQTDRHPNQIKNKTNGVQTCTVRPRGRAHFNRHYAMNLSRGAYVAENADTIILEACKKSNQFTLVATLTPHRARQKGPARIVTFSSSATSRNFTLGQRDNRLVFRLRTPRTGENGTNPQVELCTLSPNRPTHILITYQSGKLICYRNGEQVHETRRIRGGLRNWTPQHLLFGDEWNGDRSWSGALEGIAIYNRVLTPTEAWENARNYLQIHQSRSTAEQWSVKARLIGRSKTPTLAEISPYREALQVFEYRVQSVKKGTELPKRIRVAHWAILDGEKMPQPHFKAQLTIENFGANPQLESIYLSDTLEPDFDIPLYYAVQK